MLLFGAEIKNKKLVNGTFKVSKVKPNLNLVDNCSTAEVKATDLTRVVGRRHRPRGRTILTNMWGLDPHS